MTDEKIIQGITGKVHEREQALHYVYNYSGWKILVAKYTINNKGNELDGEDVFQEAVIALDRNIRIGKFRGESSLRTYFLSIARLYWLKQLKKRYPHEELSYQEQAEKVDSPEIEFIADEKRDFFDKIVSLIGEACHKVLKLYILGFSMEEMAQELSLKNAAMAKKKKYRCLEHLSRFLDEHPDWKQFILKA